MTSIRLVPLISNKSDFCIRFILYTGEGYLNEKQDYGVDALCSRTEENHQMVLNFRFVYFWLECLGRARYRSKL